MLGLYSSCVPQLRLSCIFNLWAEGDREGDREIERETEGREEWEQGRQATVHPTPTMLRFNFRPSINLKLRLADLSWIVELVFEDLSLNVDCLLCGFL